MPTPHRNTANCCKAKASIGASIDARLAASVFTRPAIEHVCRGNTDGHAAQVLRKFADAGAINGACSRAIGLQRLSVWLGQNYRAESIFKNAVANNILFGRHSPRTTAMLQEFRVKRSKADCVVINGAVHAYEIKTALDSPARLEKQLADYRTVFPRISVITDEGLAERYERLLANTSVGVIALTRDRSRLSVRRQAQWDPSELNVESMMRSLVKREYTSLVQAVTGTTPDYPSGIFFRECLRRVTHLEPIAVHEAWAGQLRHRKLLAPDTVGARNMRAVRHICVEINPDAAQARSLSRWLEETVQ